MIRYEEGKIPYGYRRVTEGKIKADDMFTFPNNRYPIWLYAMATVGLPADGGLVVIREEAKFKEEK